ncbi:amino acid adenylation domain-containing protein [Viridibacillus arvi]|uniref:amino acid adenylation domain-containing protein n=1 Tax=Viridibacillus arvi TaxID=263475 RepID=UPI0034CEAD80
MSTILKQFNEVVRNFGTNVAIKEGNKTITYTELECESNKIAVYLQEKGLEKGQFVSIYLKRSMETIISILGILKAGGVYVPLDPSHPVERTKYIINDTKSLIVITSGDLLGSVKALGLDATTNCLLMEDLKHRKAKEIAFIGDNVDDLAYVIYTSGTTGNPKGTLIRQRGVINLMNFMLPDWNITDKDIIMQFATYSFDASILDTFASLYSGATLYLIADEERMSEEQFLGVIERERISIIPAIPTVFFNRIVNYVNGKSLNTFEKVKIVGVAGELLTGDLARKFKNSFGESIRFFNLYGPTETTAIVTCYEVPNNISEAVFSVPIGDDLPGTKLYVVREDGTICATDEVGELWIASEGIALGYLNNEAKTAESFIKNPFDADIHGGMIYKSGDLVKRLSDNNIEFISRKDTQVKIRGHRIEIAEIETRMNEIDEINDAVVVVEMVDGEKTLKGFFTSDVTLTFSRIVNHLKETLPEYMIPTKMKQIDDIPFAPTGKADRRKLEQLEADAVVMTVETIVEPRNEIERDVLDAWKNVLGITNIGVTDNLFNIGGHSLNIIAILAQLKVKYKTLSIKDFFDLKTVEKLAEKVANDANLTEDVFNNEFVQLTEYPEMSVDAPLPKVETVLVTGATGFLGSHIVNKLVEEGKRVVLIVRGDDAYERANATMKYYFNKALITNIYMFNGDLTEKYMGLKKDTFDKIARMVDAVIHSAADVRHFGDRAHFEKINVQGTKNVLDLMDVNPNIVFHHVSTIGIPQDLLAEGNWSRLEGSTDIPADLSVESVYTDTKLEAEKLVLAKVKEGKQAFIYRMGNLVGRHSDGKFQRNIDANAFYRMLKLMILGKKAPNVQWKVDFMPIDFASEVVVKSVLKTDNAQRVYHVCHPNPIAFEQLIVILNDLDFDIQLVDKDEYNAYILSDAVSDEVKNLAVAQLDGDGANDSNAVYNSTGTMKALSINDIPELNKEYIGKLIQQATNVGFIDCLVAINE